MIKELTQEQIDQFPAYTKKWTEIGLCTKRANRAQAEEWCRRAYEAAGIEAPKLILWAESPIGLLLTAKIIKEIAARGLKPYADLDTASVRASVGASVEASVGASVWASVRASVRDSVRDSVWASVRDSVRDSVRASVWASVWASVRASVRDSVWDSVWDSSLRSEWYEVYSYGQHDAGWLAFYDYFREVLSLDVETRKLIPLTELAKETGWHLFYKNVAILSEKPTELHRNERGQLHNFDGPAIKWADGYRLFRFNGVRIEDEAVAMLPVSEFSKEVILGQKNADIRRELCRKIGIEKAVEILQPKIIDSHQTKSGGHYELLLIDLGDDREGRPFLKMQNPSMDGVSHIEGVEPGIRTVKAALAWRNGTEIEPEVVT